jgi:DNA polymerase III subunit alpha
MADFVHLHNHTDFSLLDAAQSVEQMCSTLTDLNMDSIAVTEHGNLFSMIPFYKEARKKGIKPILGCEIYVSVGKHNERKQVTTASGKKWGYNHLVLLCQNETGYKNLMKLVSIGYLEGFYYRPRVDKELLKKYNEGLIATTACLAGEVTHYASIGDYENAKKAAIEYSEIFPGRFYLEMQNHDIEEEKSSHAVLKKLSKDLGLPLIATNDCHYAQEDHWEAHDILFCLGMGKDRDDPNRMRYEPRQFYIKSTDEMYKLFKDCPEALENTLAIAEQCNVEIPMGNYHLPRFPIPENAGASSADDYLRILCQQGLVERYKDITPIIQRRLDYELSVIKKMGFAGYFLITMDFVKYAKNQTIPVGPGRGSAAGSIVAYTTGITDVDPIRYNLLFERFLNPERVSMPDIDIDFCIEGRQQVIDYIKERYGHDSVAQIITFGTMKAKSVVRDVGRVLGMPYGDVDRIAKLIPLEPKMTLSKAIDINKELSILANQDEIHRELVQHSKVLEGLHRHSSTHAAGVVIAPGPLTDYVPLYKPPGTNDVATQVEMNELEEMGLLKMDFLGLRNLTVINKAVKAIEQNHSVKIEIDKLNLEDEKTFKLFANGKTIGVFQFESGGMREYLKQLKPTCVEDLIAMNALYRPGPMQNIPDFIARKHGKSKIVFLHPTLEPILKETYGIIVYQEQVMEISQTIGGLSLAQGDMMRRAMGKKKADLMAAFKVDFVEGASKQNIDKKKSVEIFELLEKFAQYGFNKSHSTAYALVAYQTAWLKTHYPAEFLAANMNTEMNDIDRIVTLVSEAREMGIDVEAPDVNVSFPEFRALSGKKISFGLSAIKNVGLKAVSGVVDVREKNGPFNTIFDISKQVGSQSANRKVLESLIVAGACDNLKGSRSQNFESVDSSIKFGQKHLQDMNSDQESLFGESLATVIPEPSLPDIEEWSQEEKLIREKELIGFYLSGHPLEKHFEDLGEFNNINLIDFDPKRLPKEIRIGGIITEVRQLFDKKNRPWAIVKLEGQVGKCEIFAFADVYEKYLEIIKVDKMVFFIGSISNRFEGNDTLLLNANRFIALQNVRKSLSKRVNIRLDQNYLNEELIQNIFKLAKDNKGYCKIIFFLDDGNTIERVVSNNCLVNPSKTFIQSLRELTEINCIWIS